MVTKSDKRKLATVYSVSTFLSVFGSDFCTSSSKTITCYTIGKAIRLFFQIGSQLSLNLLEG